MQLYEIPVVKKLYSRYEVSQVILSFPSLYELLPIYEECCVLEVPDAGARKHFSMLDSAQWYGLNLLPAEFSASDDLRAYLKRSLDRRKELDELVRRVPEDTELVTIAGDDHNTPYQVRMKGFVGDYTWLPLQAGDDTVLWESAAPTETRVVLSTVRNHSGILEDLKVLAWLERLLIDEEEIGLDASQEGDPRDMREPVRVYSHEYAKNVSLKGFGLSIGNPYKGSSHVEEVVVSLFDENDQPVPGVSVTDALNADDGDRWSELNFDFRDGAYRSTFIVPDSPGIYKVSVQLTEEDALEDFFLAYVASGSAELLVAEGVVRPTEETGDEDQQQQQMAGTERPGEQDQAAVDHPLAAMLASDVLGGDVVNEQGQTAAELIDFVRRQGEQDLYAVLSVGGFLGIGDKEIVVPVQELDVTQDGQILMTNALKDQLEQMPEYNKEEYQTTQTEGSQGTPRGE